MGNNFPRLDVTERIEFPPVSQATEEGIVAMGGNLSPGVLLSAYSQGIFPWFSENEPILWWSPEPRFVLFPRKIHISTSMRKLLRKERYTITFDTDFKRIITECGIMERPGRNGTWITDGMISAYTELHELGYAHSVEVWEGETLTGGLYGVSLGSCFFGESMFTRSPNASKTALTVLCTALVQAEFVVVDCQVYTPHLETMGAELITRKQFLALLENGLQSPTLRGDWGVWFNGLKGEDVLSLKQ
jgi:leucyl/phenylalanyl-tRNA---protein transferase